jgi:hypothetical protein
MRWSWFRLAQRWDAALLCSQTRRATLWPNCGPAFAHPPDDSRIMMRWWWFGPAVEKPELERELRAMKEGGIGGVEIQPVYPLTARRPGARPGEPALSVG